jgi:hypothetical protein
MSASPSPADVALRFEDGILIGLLEASTGFVLINPPPAYTLNADEHLILLRPTSTCKVRRCRSSSNSGSIGSPTCSYGSWKVKW